MSCSFSKASAILYSFNLYNMSKSIVRQRVSNPNLLEYANKNRNEGYFNDFTIIAGNKMIYANRLVLSCYSKFFEKRLKSELYRNENMIEIEEVDGATMKALIDFIYCGSININDQNVMNLLSGADDLQLDEVKQFCFEYLEANEIELDNALDIFKMVSKHKESTLHEKVKKYICINFNKISKTEKFKDLSKEDLILCISIVDRLHANEASIYQAVVTWTRHIEVRATEFPQLLEMIKLKHMSVDLLEKIILDENLVANNPQCRKEAFAAYKQLTAEQTEKCKAKETHLISLGGFLTRQNVTVVFSLSHEASKNYPKFDEGILVYCCLKLNDCIYVIGKQRTTSLFSSNSNKFIFQLNLKKQNGKWEPVASFNKDRTSICASVFYGILFVAGGCHENLVTALSDYYDPAINKWISGPQLIQGRSDHCLVTCNGCLYALGGKSDENETLSSVEMLADLNGTWQNIQPMQRPRRKFAAVNCNGVVYAIGGYGEIFWTRHLKSVEKYDRDANRWKNVAEMKFARYKHAACVLRRKIYVVGGWNTFGKPVKEIECYDPAIDSWSIVGTVSDDLFDHELVAV